MVNEMQFRIALVERGLSQNKLAVKLGIHPSVLSACVRGYRQIEAELRKKICKELEVEPDRLFSTEGDENAN